MLHLTRQRIARWVTAAAVGAAALLVHATPALAACTCPLKWDVEIIDIAYSGVGSPYLWGHAAWSTRDRNWKGADCSGFVVKTWQVPRSSVTWEDYHPYGTYHLFNASYHWYSIGRSALAKGDAVGYPDPDGAGSASGHVVLYFYGDPYGRAKVFEAPGTDQRIRFAWRDISSSKWRFRRRHNLVRTVGP